MHFIAESRVPRHSSRSVSIQAEIAACRRPARSLCPGVPYPGVGLSFRCLFPISARGGGGFKDTGRGSQFGGQWLLSVKNVTAIFDFFSSSFSLSPIIASWSHSETSQCQQRHCPTVEACRAVGKRADVSVSGDEKRTLVKMKHGDKKYGSSETEGPQASPRENETLLE